MPNSNDKTRSDAATAASHPALFKTKYGYHFDAGDRLAVVKESDWIGGLKEALDHDLQKTVRTAIERRLKNLEARSAQLQRASTPEPQLIKLALIRAYETETQLREDIDHTHVDDLKDSLDDLPPITLFESEDGAYYIGDGWHRYHSFTNSNRKEIPAIVYPGGKQAAFLHALGANSEHNALRRSNKDKRKAVLAALKRWPDMSAREMAKLCRVSHNFAAVIKRGVSSDDTPAGKAGAADATEPPTQIDFFARLNESYKSVATGMQEILRHTYFLEPSVSKAEKLQSLEAIERDLAQQRQAVKDLRAKIEAQEESAA